MRYARYPMLAGYAERLAALRLAQGLSPRALAVRAGLSAHVVLAHESGQKTPTLGVIACLAQVLSVPAGWLAFGDLSVPGAEGGAGETFAERLLLARSRVAMPLHVLAARAGATSGLLSKWERDVIKGDNIYAQHVVPLAQALGVRPGWLAFGEDLSPGA